MSVFKTTTALITAVVLSCAGSVSAPEATTEPAERTGAENDRRALSQEAGKASRRYRDDCSGAILVADNKADPDRRATECDSFSPTVRRGGGAGHALTFIY